jgi:hypothetical protein
MNATDPSDATHTFKVPMPAGDITSATSESVTLQIDPSQIGATGLPWDDVPEQPRRGRPSSKAKAQARKRRKQAKASRRRNR